MAAGRWRLNVCGINHITSSLGECEPLAFGHADIAAAHADFAEREDVVEATIVSTCNRIEFYFVASRRADAFEIIRDFYQTSRSIDIEPLREKFQVMHNREVAQHLFRVAGGLDSMVLGENQILGQLKDAYSSACAVKAAGQVIHRLFHQAFRVGKQIRADTEMGRGACSVASAAMELLRTRLGEFEEPTVLFVGVNQMIELAASSLSREIHGPFLFANRTPEKAVALAGRFDGSGHGLDRLPELLGRADIVVTCTGAPAAIMDSPMIATAVGPERTRRLVIMDMAIPRDVDYSQDGLPGVEIFDLGDVQRHVEEQQRRRQLAIPQAEEIIERRLDEFVYWYNHVRRRPVAVSLEEELARVRAEEIEPVLARIPEDLRGELEQATENLINRLIRLTAKSCSKCSNSE